MPHISHTLVPQKCDLLSPAQWLFLAPGTTFLDSVEARISVLSMMVQGDGLAGDV